MKTKSSRAFSLVEILVALVIVSLITAALAPVITKKLSSAGITIVGGGSGSALSGPPRNQGDCNQYNALYIPKEKNGGTAVCVTKFNAGDSYGPNISGNETVLNIGDNCTTPGECCWRGATANETYCTTNGEYPACRRTICQQNVGSRICSSWSPDGASAGKWRLPKVSEAQAWYSNNLDGLNACGSVPEQGDSVCCGYKGDKTPTNNVVYQTLPHDFWLDQENASLRFNGLNFFAPPLTDYVGMQNPASIRCVTDTVSYGGGGGNASLTAAWKTPTSQADCEPFQAYYHNGLCVTKKNLGDASMSSSISGILYKSTKGACGTSGTPCCYKGASTTGSCNANGSYQNYSGCNRTICNWNAANIGCNSYSIGGTGGRWRLPTSDEQKEWESVISGSQLDLCDDTKSSSNIPFCNYIGYNSETYYTGCLWNKTAVFEDGSGRGYWYIRNGTWVGPDGTTAYNEVFASVRCVLDKVPYYTESSGGGGSSGQVDIKTDCSSVDSNCQLCTNSQCITCKQGYTLNDEGKCEIDNSSKEYLYPNQPQNQEECSQWNAKFIPAGVIKSNRNVCMTKWNAGDTDSGYSTSPKGPTIPTDKVTVVNVGTSCPTSSTPCCWKGVTSNICENSYSPPSHTGRPTTAYSGCKRTVCNTLAAEEICSNYAPAGTNKGDWRLPTISEFHELAQTMNAGIDFTDYGGSEYLKNIGSDGLQFCDNASGYGVVQCTVNIQGKCPDVGTGECYPFYVHIGNNIYYFLLNGVFWGPKYYKISHPASVRCIYDPPGILKDFEYDCPVLFDNCESCTKSQCTACKSGYVLEHGLCVAEHPATREPASQEDCNPFNALFIPKEWNGGVSNICVTKYNVGDPGGPPIKSSVKKLIAGDSQSVCKTDEQGNCCWQGRTAGQCNDTDKYGSTYSGCSRTVCQWQASKDSCENWAPLINGFKVSGWRLPTKVEYVGWNNQINLTTGKDVLLKQMGADGLQMCGSDSDYIINCGGTINQCFGADADSGYYDGCYPYDYHGENVNGQLIDDRMSDPTASSNTNYKNYAFSARCVLDKLPYNFIGSTSANFAAPTERKTVYTKKGIPQKQADCDPYNAIFVPAKYNGNDGVNLCVAKYPVGHAGGPPIVSDRTHWSSISIIYAGGTCDNSSGSCVWYGKTAANGCSNVGIGGCTRTVMGIYGAHYSCIYWTPEGTEPSDWRLPTYEEAKGWRDSYNNNVDKARAIFADDRSGLNFCSLSTTATRTELLCPKYTVCIGSYADVCLPAYIWLNNKYYLYLSSGKLGIGSDSINGNYAQSARCVSHNVPIR